MTNAQRLQLADLSALRCDYYGIGQNAGLQPRILRIAFSGSYGAGSAGNGDARFMGALVAAGRTAWQPRAIVLDLSELAYTWGNALLAVFDLRFQLPLAVVVGPACAEAVRGLASTHTGLGVPIDPDWIFDDLEGALRFLGHDG